MNRDYMRKNQHETLERPLCPASDIILRIENFRKQL